MLRINIYTRMMKGRSSINVKTHMHTQPFNNKNKRKPPCSLLNLDDMSGNSLKKQIVNLVIPLMSSSGYLGPHASTHTSHRLLCGVLFA